MKMRRRRIRKRKRRGGIERGRERVIERMRCLNRLEGIEGRIGIRGLGF
jgi:hypothetical protein